MYSLSVNTKRWRIEEDNETVFSGIGTASQAIALAKSRGIVLTHFYNLTKLKSVA